MQQGALFYRHRRILYPCLILYCTLGKCSRACLLDKWPAREEKCAARKTDSIIINLRGIRDLVGSTFYLTLGSESVMFFLSDSGGKEQNRKYQLKKKYHNIIILSPIYNHAFSKTVKKYKTYRHILFNTAGRGELTKSVRVKLFQNPLIISH